MKLHEHVDRVASKLGNLESLWRITGRSPNEAQMDAIHSVDGPLLIIAGPGSGKTFTLVDRVVHLVTEMGKEPENLMVVTFTEKAASELQTRISNRLIAIGARLNLNEMYLGTFHSICLRWLEEYREFTRLKRSFTMMDQFDQQYFLYQRLRGYEKIEGIGHVIGKLDRSAWYKTKDLVRWINTASEEALDPEVLKLASDEPVRVLGEAFALYQQQLEEANALDFATIQYEALKLLRSHPEAKAALRERISHIMVDEYQDTNTIQESILFELVGSQPNICVVGDDDQGLYRFRGATIRNILEFPENFPEGDCQEVELVTNYRSHPDIIRFYNRWIQSQQWDYQGKRFRFDKEVVPPEKKKFPDVPGVVKVSANSQDGYHQEVLTFLRTMKEKGQLKDWNQVAFLFRSVKNKKVVALARFLEQNGVPVYSPRSNQFFEREEIRLMIGALIFLFPQFAKARKWRSDAYLSIWDYYDQRCFKPFADELRKPENALLLNWAKAMAKIHANLDKNTDYAFSTLFYQLLQFPLFSRYLDEQKLHGNLRDMRAMRNLALFSALLSKVEYLHHISVLTPEYLDKSLRDLFNQFLRFLMDGGIDEYEDKSEYAPSGSVSFLTIHQSKGLEFPVVIVGSLEAFPRKQHKPLDEMLEQGYLSRPAFEPLSEVKHYDFRRLFYTAFSRAQNLLVLATHEKDGRGRSPSKYIAPIYDDLISWRDPSFRPADLPLDMVKDIDLKQVYSFTSHLTVFENCAEQYRFYRELEFSPMRTSPILFGTVVHQTIEDIHKTVLRDERERLSEEQVQSWFEVNYTNLTKRERVYLAPYVRDLAMEHVLRYYRRHQSDWSHIREAEVDVSLVKDDYILKGTVDLIAGKGDTVELVDFKSEKKPDVNEPDDREKLERYRRQLEVYAHLVEERTGLEVSKSHLYYTSEETGNPYISFEKDDRAIDKTIQTFDRVVERIEKKDFGIAERPGKLCRDCAMRYYCDLKNWKFRQSPKGGRS
jgi:DNA helicase II / ATP-dependent DNA helicase PcrA